MTRVYIPYGTTEGKTAKIAEYIADVIRHHGHEAEPTQIGQVRNGITGGYDGVIVGAAIHMGKHDKHIVEFARKNRDLLERLPSAFFSVSLAVHGDAQEAEGYVRRFEQETGWRPSRIACFAGALAYTQYGFVKRHVIEEDRRGQARQLGHRHLARLRLHEVG